MTQRGRLSHEDHVRLAEAAIAAEEAAAYLRRVAVEMVGKSSFREVARALGVSTNTLQRWKREAGK